MHHGAPDNRTPDDPEAHRRLLEMWEHLRPHIGRIWLIVRYRSSPDLLRRYGADDLAQEAILEILGQSAGFVYSGDETFARFVALVTRRTVARWARTLTRHPEHDRLPETGTGSSFAPAAGLVGIADPALTPMSALSITEGVDRIWSAMAVLSSEEQAAVMLVYVERYSVLECARLMGYSRDAMGKLIARAVDRLAQALEELG